MSPESKDSNPLEDNLDDILREVDAEPEQPEAAEAAETAEAAEAASTSEDEPQDQPAVEPEEADPMVQMQTELAQAKDRWLRAMAEVENLRKRNRREVQTSTNLAKASVLRELLEVVDNFGRALDSAPWEDQDDAVKAFADGVRMIYRQFVEILRQNGLQRIEARGAAFDPNLHEAISQIETGDVPSQHVVEVVQEGYLLNDMVVRPARVVVAV